MDPLIGSQSNYEIESQNTLRLRLSDTIISPLTDGIPHIFNDLLANKKLNQEIKSLNFLTTRILLIIY